MMTYRELPLPPHFTPQRTAEVWRVPYQDRAREAGVWAKQHRIPPSSQDRFQMALLLVDAQNTFCIPGFELYVGGRTGTGAVDDNRRLCEFIYRNAAAITEICPTLDTHRALQIFHDMFLVNAAGEHPPPYTTVTVEDIETGVWKFNPALSEPLGLQPGDGQAYLRHYTAQLKKGRKYELTVWPYHAMLGSIGHALVSSVEEAVFFHGIARRHPPAFQIKGNHPLTENYSVLRPEVLDGPNGEIVAQKNAELIRRLLAFDAVIVTGQAKSHCVAWTVEDLLQEIRSTDEALAGKVYLLEDCTSPVVIPGGIDYTDAADAAFARFENAGMHRVRSTDPIATWPGMPPRAG